MKESSCPQCSVSYQISIKSLLFHSVVIILAGNRWVIMGKKKEREIKVPWLYLYSFPYKVLSLKFDK